MLPTADVMTVATVELHHYSKVVTGSRPSKTRPYDSNMLLRLIPACIDKACMSLNANWVKQSERIDDAPLSAVTICTASRASSAE